MGQGIKDRIAVIQRLMGEQTTPASTGNASASNGNGDNNPDAGLSADELRKKYSISDEKLAAVLDFMKKHPHARQSDIAAQTAFNSGTVSIALRLLRAQGHVKPAGRDNGSRAWELVRVPAHA